MTVRCKMKLVEIVSYAYGPGKKFVFRPEYDQSIPEDMRFVDATPNGEFSIYVNNPTVIEHYKLGQFYYFESVPVPMPEPATKA